MFMSTEGLRAIREITVYGPEICGGCTRFIKKLADNGILAVKVVIDSDHEVTTALREGGELVEAPIVYIDDQFVFSGRNMAAWLVIIEDEKALLKQADLVDA